MKIKNRLSILALLAMLSIPALGQARQTCQRFDSGGHSVAEVVFEKNPSQLRKVTPVREAAQVLKEALDYLMSQEKQRAWDLCAYDGVVLVDPETDFRTTAVGKKEMQRGLMFTLDLNFPIYVNSRRYKDEVIFRWRGNRNKQLGYTALYLFHELTHVGGGDQAAAFAAEQRFAHRLTVVGLLDEKDETAIARQIAQEERRHGFNEATVVPILSTGKQR